MLSISISVPEGAVHRGKRDKKLCNTFLFTESQTSAECTKAIEKYKSEDAKSLRQTRISDSPNFSTEVEIDLYGGDKVGIMAFKEKVGLIIESKKIFNTLKSIFDSHWEMLGVRKTPKKALGSW